MRKAIFLIAGLAVALVGTAIFAAIRDECSYAPDGKFDVRLVPDGIAHFFDEDHACDPWKVVEPDNSIQSVTILPYSSWTLAPARAVTVERNGKLTISEPVATKGPDPNWSEWEYRKRHAVNNPPLARTLLESLSRIVRFNRVAPENADELVARLEAQGADLSDSQNYLVDPIIPCRGRVYDAGGVRLEVETKTGKKHDISLDSSCHSIAKEQAIDATWDARHKVYDEAAFDGEHLVDELATFGL